MSNTFPFTCFVYQCLCWQSRGTVMMRVCYVGTMPTRGSAQIALCITMAITVRGPVDFVVCILTSFDSIMFLPITIPQLRLSTINTLISVHVYWHKCNQIFCDCRLVLLEHWPPVCCHYSIIYNYWISLESTSYSTFLLSFLLNMIFQILHHHRRQNVITRVTC
jgi:hypothetical protein